MKEKLYLLNKKRSNNSDQSYFSIFNLYNIYKWTEALKKIQLFDDLQNISSRLGPVFLFWIKFWVDISYQQKTISTTVY